VNVAIAISTDVTDKIDGVGQVGGVVGSSVSASFLFVVGLANSIILHRVLRKRRRNKKRREQQLARGEQPDELGDILEDDGQYNNTIMMKILGPVVRFVDRPWKMYPVGLLFGFGFDTASSIALLAASAIAKKGADSKGIPPGDIVILPMLFTAGMTLLDSIDSILMLYSYTGFAEHRFHLFEPVLENDARDHKSSVYREAAATSVSPIHLPHSEGSHENETKPCPLSAALSERSEQNGSSQGNVEQPVEVQLEDKDAKVRDIRKEAQRELIVKRNMMSGLSILLTLMSIVVAFSISLITIMGLIGDNCVTCSAAARNDKGLAGGWWRFWAEANDNSGYIGAGIVGSFVLVVGGWYGGRWVFSKWKRARR